MSFALFGIGDDAFAPWKVMVSGLHRTPRFASIRPVDEDPVLWATPAACLSPFQEEHAARVEAEILNTEECKAFLTSLTFTDFKRLMTIALLRRLNIRALAVDCGSTDERAAHQNRAVHCTEQHISMQADFMMERPTRRASLERARF